MKLFGIYANNELTEVFKEKSINDIDMDWTTYLDGADEIEYGNLSARSIFNGKITMWEIKEIAL